MTRTGSKTHRDFPPPPLDDNDEEEETTLLAPYNPYYGSDPGREAPTPPDETPPPMPEEYPPPEPEVPFPPPQELPPDMPSPDMPPPDIPPGGSLPLGTRPTGRSWSGTGPGDYTDDGIRRPELTPGTIINGNYKIMEELKSGGMGRVFRGETIGNELPVAIKTVKAELADKTKYGDLFRSESKILGTLRDDAIVNYMNFQYDAVLNRWFMVMEFISGEALSDYVSRNGGITVVQAARLARRLATGLAKAHERGVIHRDLSPDNVMLRNGDLSQAVLIDFGIAREVIGQDSAHRSSFAGKLKYAAPEQMGLFDGEIGPQTDVYGLGLLLAAALTGRPLPMGRNLEGAKDCRRAVPDLSSVPVPFRPLLTQMLQPDPLQRPQGMHAVIANLPPVEGKTVSGLSTGSLGAGPEIIAPVPGLRRPPRVTGPLTGTTTGTLGGTHSAGSLALGSTAQERLPRAETAGTKPESRSPLPALLLGAVVLAGAGGAGYVLFSGGDAASPVEAEATVVPPEAAPTEASFLAGFDMGKCTFAALQGESEAQAGAIVLYTASAMATGPLQDAFGAQFGGAVPQVAEETVSPMQCAVLDAARQLGSLTADPIRIAHEPGAGDMLSGAIIDPKDRRIWFAAVNRNGVVTPLNSYRGEKIGKASPFEVPINPASTNFPFVIVALATPVPLIETALVSSGTTADQLFGKLVQEIRDKKIGAESAIRLLRIDAP